MALFHKFTQFGPNQQLQRDLKAPKTFVDNIYSLPWGLNSTQTHFQSLSRSWDIEILAKAEISNGSRKLMNMKWKNVILKFLFERAPAAHRKEINWTRICYRMKEQQNSGSILLSFYGAFQQ